MTAGRRSLQETYAPDDVCFGCGQANPNGLRQRSTPAGGDVVEATWTPQPHHQAFPGVLNGGIIGTLMDCHSNWTAAYHLMQRLGGDRPPLPAITQSGCCAQRHPAVRCACERASSIAATAGRRSRRS